MGNSGFPLLQTAVLLPKTQELTVNIAGAVSVLASCCQVTRVLSGGGVWQELKQR